jgi:hypothetical protein
MAGTCFQSIEAIKVVSRMLDFVRMVDDSIELKPLPPISQRAVGFWFRTRCKRAGQLLLATIPHIQICWGLTVKPAGLANYAASLFANINETPSPEQFTEP